jgi:archaellum component FlaC
LTYLTYRTSDTRDSEKKRPVIPYKRSPYHQLENKVDKLQEQVDRFNALPTNEDLRELRKGDAERPRPVSEMWQTMQLKNRVDANEDGVSKLMSLIEDLMDDVVKLKEENGKLQSQLKDAKDLEDLMNRLKSLEQLTNDLKDKFATFPDPDTFTDFVTWQGLEDALKGVREELQPKERVVIEMSQQTVTPVQSRPPSRRMSTPGPSNELLELLERLGILTNKHDKLEIRVEDIEAALKNKVNKEDLDGIGDVPDDLKDQLRQLSDDVDSLKKARDKVGNCWCHKCLLYGL